MRIKNLLLGVVSLALVVGGLAVMAYGFVGQGAGDTASNRAEPEGFNVPEIEPTRGANETAGGPEDKTLKVTIPKMARVKDGTFPDAGATDRRGAETRPVGAATRWPRRR